MIAKANQATGNRLQPDTLLGRILLVGMLNGVYLGPGEHKRDQCLKHAQEISTRGAPLRPAHWEFIGLGLVDVEGRPKGNTQKMGHSCETHRVRIQRVKSPSLPGTHGTLLGNTQATEQSAHDASKRGSRKH